MRLLYYKAMRKKEVACYAFMGAVCAWNISRKKARRWSLLAPGYLAGRPQRQGRSFPLDIRREQSSCFHGSQMDTKYCSFGGTGEISGRLAEKA